MAEVLASINCDVHDEHGAETKLRTFAEVSRWIHLDIADGVFTFGKSWGTPDGWKKIVQATKAEVKLEVHLMVEHPERVVQEWLDVGAKRVIVHYEAFPKTHSNQDKLRAKGFAEIIERCHHAGAEAMLALLPETSLKTAEPYLAHFDGYQVFTQAHPGPSGQKFLASVLQKVTALRTQFPDATIEVDGGVVYESARLAVAAGANALVSGSYLLSAPDIHDAYKKLSELE